MSTDLAGVISACSQFQPLGLGPQFLFCQLERSLLMPLWSTLHYLHTNEVHFKVDIDLCDLISVGRPRLQFRTFELVPCCLAYNWSYHLLCFGGSNSFEVSTHYSILSPLEYLLSDVYFVGCLLESLLEFLVPFVTSLLHEIAFSAS